MKTRFEQTALETAINELQSAMDSQAVTDALTAGRSMSLTEAYILATSYTRS